MNREIIAVYDIEPEFASRFVSYLKSKYEERYDMYAFTELTALLEFVEKHRADATMPRKSRPQRFPQFPNAAYGSLAKRKAIKGKIESRA